MINLPLHHGIVILLPTRPSITAGPAGRQAQPGRTPRAGAAWRLRHAEPSSRAKQSSNYRRYKILIFNIFLGRMVTDRRSRWHCQCWRRHCHQAGEEEEPAGLTKFLDQASAGCGMEPTAERTTSEDDLLPSKFLPLVHRLSSGAGDHFKYLIVPEDGSRRENLSRAEETTAARDSNSREELKLFAPRLRLMVPSRPTITDQPDQFRQITDEEAGSRGTQALITWYSPPPTEASTATSQEHLSLPSSPLSPSSSPSPHPHLSLPHPHLSLPHPHLSLPILTSFSPSSPLSPPSSPPSPHPHLSPPILTSFSPILTYLSPPSSALSPPSSPLSAHPHLSLSFRV
ncbi:unnamed protein product [Pleuronectes platessa]|uniref:Uncharacterized protein n=1 Tax=Pleuronectes platessa TaxID=8262 RepID=A0A9N7U171_PLEPL|nr:unnamed protein product [Pleuronectes platessa]